jgi:hypothetical protein
MAYRACGGASGGELGLNLPKGLLLPPQASYGVRRGCKNTPVRTGQVARTGVGYQTSKGVLSHGSSLLALDIGGFVDLLFAISS